MGDFPQGYFFISNVSSGMVLDVDGNSKEPGAKVIIWNKKTGSNDNQLWSYDNGFIINKNSGLVLEVPGYESGGNIAPGTRLVQAQRRERPSNLNQLWAHNYQFLMPYDPKVTVAVEGGNITVPGTNAIADTRSFEDERQKWNFVGA